MEIPAKGWHGDLAPERLLQKGVLHGTKSCGRHVGDAGGGWRQTLLRHRWGRVKSGDRRATAQWENRVHRSEEHTSERQSPCNLVCRRLVEKKRHRARGGGSGDRASAAPTAWGGGGWW